MHRTFACLLTALFFIWTANGAAHAKRIALVIGNSAYQHTTSLRNPANDAELISETLVSVGFQVTKVLDADLDTMKRAMLTFGRSIRDDTEVSLFYYAGHGVQVRGKNYLLPTNAQITDQDEIDLEALNVNSFLRVMNASASKINIVVLDSCRNNPFESAFRSVSRGLAPVLAPKGTYVAYATAPGSVAFDGSGRNSFYTEALAEAISLPGLEIAKVFRTARAKVIAKTNEKQVPWESSSIVGDFYFKPLQTVQPIKQPEQKVAVLDRKEPPGQLTAATAWEAAKDSKFVGDYKLIIESFPNTFYARLAQNRIDELNRKNKQRQDTERKEALVRPPVKKPRPARKDTQILTGNELTREVQRELKRLGCNPGNLDGKWGEMGTAALDLYTETTKRAVPSKSPSLELLAFLRVMQADVCPKITQGTYTWSNGSKFVGDMVNGIPRGQGVVTWDNVKDSQSLMYIGGILNGKRFGKGINKYTSGASYDGNWKNDTREGFGVYKYPKGGVYEGNFVKGERSGKGKYQFPDGGIYDGSWKVGKRNGLGVYKYPGGGVYDGNFVNGERSGAGTYRFPNGGTYKGNYVKGARSGAGYYRYPDGGTYDGNFVNNQRSGYGVYRYKGGQVYKGGWLKGKKSGKGVYTWNASTSFDGVFKNDKPNGYGVRRHNGKTWKGNWKNGCYKKGKTWAYVFTTKKACGF